MMKMNLIKPVCNCIMFLMHMKNLMIFDVFEELDETLENAQKFICLSFSKKGRVDGNDFY